MLRNLRSSRWWVAGSWSLCGQPLDLCRVRHTQQRWSESMPCLPRGTPGLLEGVWGRKQQKKEGTLLVGGATQR